jgi:hypothetical protein
MSELDALIAALACMYPTGWKGTACYTDVSDKELARMRETRQLSITRRANDDIRLTVSFASPPEEK